MIEREVVLLILSDNGSLSPSDNRIIIPLQPQFSSVESQSLSSGSFTYLPVRKESYFPSCVLTVLESRSSPRYKGVLPFVGLRKSVSGFCTLKVGVEAEPSNATTGLLPIYPRPTLLARANINFLLKQHSSVSYEEIISLFIMWP